MGMEQLAIFGGTPVREQPLGYGKQWIEEDDIQAVAEVLEITSPGETLRSTPSITALPLPPITVQTSSRCSWLW